MPAYKDILTEIPSITPFVSTREQKVIVSEFETGLEQRRLIDGYVRRVIKLKYPILTYSQAKELKDFYEEMHGPYQDFGFAFPQTGTYVKELVGVASSITNIIRLPSKEAVEATCELYIDDVLLDPLYWDFFPSGSDDGGDKAVLDLPVQAGQRLTFSFEGRLKIRARFSEDPIVFDDIKKYWSSTTVTLIGLVPIL